MGVPAAVGLAGSLLVAAPPLRPVLAVGAVPARRRVDGAAQHTRHFRDGARDQACLQGRAWVPRSRGRDDLPRVVDRPRRPPPGSPPERPRPVTRIVSPTAGSHRPGIPAPSRPKPSHRHPGAACVIRRVAVARLINKLRVPRRACRVGRVYRSLTVPFIRLKHVLLRRNRKDRCWRCIFAERGPRRR